MARGVTAPSNHSAATGEKTVPKRRFRGKIPLKPKGALCSLLPVERQRPTTGHSLAASVNPFSSVPRVIRTRIERATEPRQTRKAKKVADVGNVEQKNQPLARSSSGKVALGPWSGPFGSTSFSDEELPVLYLDRSGSAHLDLDDKAMGDAQQQEAKKQASSGASKKAGHIVAQAAALQVPLSNKEHKVHSMEISHLQSKPLARDTVRGGAHSKKGHVSNRVGVINQPRRS
ncbi:hypothetical protein BSKO_08643 [Bryopsis sp. KO-2023]|nr:hypothetical protein BSKO_08643 [Bryopsis sp. KO-2023]